MTAGFGQHKCPKHFRRLSVSTACKLKMFLHGRLFSCRHVAVRSHNKLLTINIEKNTTILLIFACSHWQKNNVRIFMRYFRAVLWVFFDDLVCVSVYSANAVFRLIGALLWYKQKKTLYQKTHHALHNAYRISLHDGCSYRVRNSPFLTL